MTNNTEPAEQTHGAAATPQDKTEPKATIAWIAIVFALAAWILLFWSNGYIALVLAAAGAVCGFVGIPGRPASVKRLATTAIIASLVLVVVVSAYLMVLKIGLR